MSVPKIFSAECEGQTLIVSLLGNVSSLAEDEVRPELDALLEQLQQAELKHVVIDFEKVSYFGTTTLAAMHAIWRRVRDAHGKMVLCNLSTMGREILHVSGFHALWPIHTTREEALRAVKEQTGGT